MVTVFGYYLVSFLGKYISEDIYSETYASAAGDIISIMGYGYVYALISYKKSSNLAFITTLIGTGVLIAIFWTMDTENEEGIVHWLIIIFVFIARLGLSASFGLVYFITYELFPPQYTSTVYGFTNLFARFITILAPFIAEVDLPVPLYILFVINIFALFCANLIKPSEIMLKR